MLLKEAEENDEADEFDNDTEIVSLFPALFLILSCRRLCVEI